MILSAGRGLRLMPITKDTPKPLVKIGKQALLERNINLLYQSGIREIIVNGSWLGDKIESFIANIQLEGLKLHYLYEGSEPLGTAGAVYNAIDHRLLLNENFWLVNSDIITNFSLPNISLINNRVGHLILVPNPDHNSAGDFGLRSDQVLNESIEMHTFSGISFLSCRMFDETIKRPSSLVDILRDNIKHNLISGELFLGEWLDVGTIERLNRAHNKFGKS
ncbi:MAG: nucleotidyltransferase family protein [Gammaproteobacteria bacterium]